MSLKKAEKEFIEIWCECLSRNDEYQKYCIKYAKLHKRLKLSKLQMLDGIYLDVYKSESKDRLTTKKRVREVTQQMLSQLKAKDKGVLVKYKDLVGKLNNLLNSMRSDALADPHQLYEIYDIFGDVKRGEAKEAAEKVIAAINADARFNEREYFDDKSALPFSTYVGREVRQNIRYIEGFCKEHSTELRILSERSVSMRDILMLRRVASFGSETLLKCLDLKGCENKLDRTLLLIAFTLKGGIALTHKIFERALRGIFAFLNAAVNEVFSEQSRKLQKSVDNVDLLLKDIREQLPLWLAEKIDSDRRYFPVIVDASKSSKQIAEDLEKLLLNHRQRREARIKMNAKGRKMDELRENLKVFDIDMAGLAGKEAAEIFLSEKRQDEVASSDSSGRSSLRKRRPLGKNLVKLATKIDFPEGYTMKVNDIEQ